MTKKPCIVGIHCIYININDKNCNSGFSMRKNVAQSESPICPTLGSIWFIYLFTYLFWRQLVNSVPEKGAGLTVHNTDVFILHCGAALLRQQQQRQWRLLLPMCLHPGPWWGSGDFTSHGSFNSWLCRLKMATKLPVVACAFTGRRWAITTNQPILHRQGAAMANTSRSLLS